MWGEKYGCGCVRHSFYWGVRELQVNSFKNPFLLNDQEEFDISKWCFKVSAKFFTSLRQPKIYYPDNNQNTICRKRSPDECLEIFIEEKMNYYLIKQKWELVVIHLCNKHLLKAFYVSSTIQITKKIKNEWFISALKATTGGGWVRVGGE